MINDKSHLRKVVNTIYIGIRDTHPRYIKLLYFYISYIEFHIFVYPPIIGKRIPVLPPPPCSYFFFIRGCHISSFLFFESPVRCPRTKRVHGNVTEREIKASREKIAISRRSDVALYHHGNGPFSFETDVSNLPCRRNF